MAFLFENLEVYQKAIAFADAISDLTEDFSKGNYYLIDQLNRAALSIATNIAEGNGRFDNQLEILKLRTSAGVNTGQPIVVIDVCGIEYDAL